MQRIDFYLLTATSTAERLQFCCRLAEKAWKSQMNVVVYAADKGQAEQLDRQLWAFREDAFVPHQLWDKASTNYPEPPITVITWASNNAPLPASDGGLLINLAPTPPEGLERFLRLAEVVIDEPAIKQQTRANYRRYQQQGLPLKMHQLG